MDEKLKATLEEALKATESLANASAVSDGKFLVTLLGMFRVSFTTLRDIYYLIQSEGTGPSILDLTRKIMEHGISIEYMIMKDKEVMSARFQEYLIVQTRDELEFYRSTSGVPEELKEGAERNDKEYEALSKDVKDRKNWAGRSMDGMFEDLNTAGTLTGFDISRGTQAYIWGSRLNHPNPMAVHSYLEPEEAKIADGFFSRLGIAMAIAFSFTHGSSSY